MKKATKLTAAALAATLSLSLAACGSSASTGTASTSASADGVVYRTLDEIKAERHDQHRRVFRQEPVRLRG